MRIGHGYDAHRFAEGRRLVLGGVEIAHEFGLAAHSDGDVVLHALCDALLGAAGLGDIGEHFPDTDAAFEGADSRVLLRQTLEMILERGFRVGNADLTVLAQAPKLSPHKGMMRERIAKDLRVSLDRVNLKASTTEGMGFVGREEGIACHAVVLLHD